MSGLGLERMSGRYLDCCGASCWLIEMKRALRGISLLLSLMNWRWIGSGKFIQGISGSLLRVFKIDRCWRRRG